MMAVLTVRELAEAKGLPAEFLETQLGLRDDSRGVVIPYHSPDGTPAPRSRLRTHKKAGEGSSWLGESGPIVPYGTERLAEARKEAYLILVEGESDAWTLWHHGYPCLGIPGCSMSKLLEREHLDGIERVFLWKEPDQGGTAFENGIRNRLEKIGWNGDFRVVRIVGVKDANDLHLRGESSFARLMEEALANAASPIRKLDGSPVECMIAESGLLDLSDNATTSEIGACLRVLSSAARELEGLDQQLLREDCLKLLKKLRCSAPAKLLDSAFSERTVAEQDDGSRVPLFEDLEPHAQPVNGATLLDEIVNQVRTHVIVEEGAAEAVALWVLLTYTFQCFGVLPLLAITSPVKRCGKTTLLSLISALVLRPISASNITPASLFRTIEEFQPTLLIDEADTFLAKSGEMRGILNSGHTRNTAQVIRTVGDDHQPRVFSTWGCKAIALIGQLKDTLADRAIPVSMRRRRKEETVCRLRSDRIAGLLRPIREKAYRWALDHQDDLKELEPNVPDDLHDRAQDNWRSLLSIADLAGGDWPARAREVALALERGDGQSDESIGVLLLEDLRRLFRKKDAERLKSKEICLHLASLEERPWPEFKNGNPITPRQAAHLLRPFDVCPKQLKFDGVNCHGYELAAFADAFGRYLDLDPPATDATSPTDQQLASDLSRYPRTEGSGSEPGVSVSETNEVAKVADQLSLLGKVPSNGEPRRDVDLTTEFEEFDL